MFSGSSQNITGLLLDWQQGDQSAIEKLTPIIYDELRRIAHRYVRRERQGHTLETTALVNEAYLRVARQQQMKWQNRAHLDRKSTRLNSSHLVISYAVFCLKKK